MLPRTWPLDLLDALFITGLVLLAVGLWLIWEPLALAVAGVILMGWALITAVGRRAA